LEDALPIEHALGVFSKTPQKKITPQFKGAEAVSKQTSASAIPKKLWPALRVKFW
jgi:hypothetical protein